MSGIMQMLLAAFQRVTDPFFEYVTLLLPGNGTNGAQNNTFLDSSTNAFSITRNGNTTQGTFSPFSQTGWSNYFDGSGDYLTAPDNAASEIGASDFCVEGWFYPTVSNASYQTVFCKNQVGITNGYGPIYITFISGVMKAYAASGSSSWNVLSNVTIGTPQLNAWNHFVVCRSGANWGLYLNGTRNSTASSTATLLDNSANYGIGAQPAGAEPTTGYLSGIRLVIGSSVYDPTQSTLTVPTAPLTAISGTSLLTCQSNRFIDNSSNAFAITRNGDVSVQAFSPFNPTAAWSAATNGGSGYFDGSGDYLEGSTTLSTSTSMSTFTIECWIYPTTFATVISVIGDMSPTSASDTKVISADITTAGKVQLYWYDGAVKSCTGDSVLQLNAWNYFAIVVNSNAISIYVNKTTADTLTGTTTLTNRTQTRNFSVGAYYNVTPFKGYLGSTRFSTSARTISAVPTTPLTSDANTRLLLNFTNAGIYDATSKNDLETVGNAQISTTQSKFGGSSMYFDGTGDYLFRNGASDLFVINSDYTVECWVYFNSTSGTQILVSYGTLPWYLCIGDITAGKAQFTWSSSAPTNYHATGTTTLSTGTWYHIAGVRYGSNIYLYVNGIQEAVTAISGSPRSPSTNALAIGAMASGSSTANAYIQDVRITKGIARYTSNFTPPTTAFLTL